jgi:hypothetical protein
LQGEDGARYTLLKTFPSHTNLFCSSVGRSAEVWPKSREPVFVINREANWGSIFVNLKLDKTAAQLALQKDHEIKV